MTKLIQRRATWQVGLLAVVLAAGAFWWWSSSNGEAALDPLGVACEGPGLPDRPDHFIAEIPPAPEAVRAEPAADDDPQPLQPLAFVPPGNQSSPWSMGYQLDPDNASVSYISGFGRDAEPEWVREVNDGPLWAELEAFPGNPDLLLVTGQQREDAAGFVAVLDDDGELHLSCTAPGVPSNEAGIIPPVLSPDGSVLLALHADEDDQRWIEAYATGNAEHLWSAPGTSFTAGDDQAYVARESGVVARDLTSGEQVWEREVATNFDDAPSVSGRPDPSDTWDLRLVDDELYAYRHGSRRLVGLAARDGRIAWDLAPGDNEVTRMKVTQLDDDHSVLLDFGKDFAVRAPDKRELSWIHRGTEHSRATHVLARSGEPALIAIQPNDPDHAAVAVYTQAGEQLLDISLPDPDYSVAVADTVVYALNKDDRTVTGYDVETADELWTAQVPVDDDVVVQGINALDGGFRVFVGRNAFIRFSD